MTDLKTLSVVIVHQDLDEANRLTSVLDNTGHVIHAHQVSSSAELNQILSNNPIELIISEVDSGIVNASELLKVIKGLFKDIPVVFVHTEYDGKKLTNCLRLGGQDMVVADHDQHLIAVVQRELRNLNERKQRRDIEMRFHDTEQRCMDLLRDSLHPTALVHDSMLVFSNPAFAEKLGYGTEDFECLPVFDILGKEAQQRYKTIYKQFSENPSEFAEQNLELALRTNEGDELAAKMEIRHTKFNGEDCLEFGITHSGDSEEEIDLDGQSLLIPRHKMMQAIGRSMRSAHQNKDSSAVFCVAIDEYDSIRKKLGLGATDELYHNLNQLIRDDFPDMPSSRFGENQLILLGEQLDRKAASELAGQLCQLVEDARLEADGIEHELTCSIGVSLVNDLSTNSEEVLDQSVDACLAYSKDSKTNGNGYRVFTVNHEADEVDFGDLLDQAFIDQHLEMLYQPIQKLTGAAVEQYSVLVGIKEEFRELYPENFIQLASRNRDNLELDRWVILGSLRTLIHKSSCSGTETLHIQISRSSLNDHEFIGWLREAITRSKLPPKQLTFQLRELDVSTNLDASKKLVAAIHDMGARVCVAQFGLAIQPLKLIDAVDFDCVKIDGSFSTAAQEKADELPKLIELIGQVAELEKTIVVPMIERPAILPHLWKAKVGYIEGYYVQRPHTEMAYKF